MAAPTYEIEIKSLLGEAGAADCLRQKLGETGAAARHLGKHRQLNHYFTGGELVNLIEPLRPYLAPAQGEEFRCLAHDARQYSLRTRDQAGTIILVVKISLDDETSANGAKRLEFESVIPSLSLEELDKIILKAGFSYEAKWSREREDYELGEIKITIDKNAGYGYLAEFEITTTDPAKIQTAKEKLLGLVHSFDLEELSPERLERMFAFYNTHWPEYYGTDKVFIVS